MPSLIEGKMNYFEANCVMQALYYTTFYFYRLCLWKNVQRMECVHIGSLNLSGTRGCSNNVSELGHWLHLLDQRHSS